MLPLRVRSLFHCTASKLLFCRLWLHNATAALTLILAWIRPQKLQKQLEALTADTDALAAAKDVLKADQPAEVLLSVEVVDCQVDS